jgi:hypothetical protein
MTGNGVIVRAALYFLIALLTPVASVMSEAAVGGSWPSLSALASAALTGTVAGLVALRAYLDGSNERFEAGNAPRDRRESDRGGAE